MKLRRAWVQIHWFVGITAGTLLMLIGLSGAALGFREELLDAMNPGGRAVPVSSRPVLSVPQLLQALDSDGSHRSVGTITVQAKAGAAVRVIFAPRPGEASGETVYLDPYLGLPLPALRGAGFFEFCERFHRWLLLPREAGRATAGVLAACLLLLALSGLYLRWPRHPLRWRAWLTFDVTKRGRAFLWGLHSVAGTLALAVYLVSTGTGLYWAFDLVRQGVDTVAGERAAVQERTARRAGTPGARRARGAAGDTAAVDIGPAWATFDRLAANAGGWSEAIVRVQRGPQTTLLVTWLDAHPAHERARNRTTIALPGGEVVQDERYAAKAAGGRFVAAIYPLHTGSYFGWPGRIAMTATALMLPGFGITGWMMYLTRRRAVARR